MDEVRPNAVFILLSRLVGLVYFIAIFPLYFQIEALIGENGLQPAIKLLAIAQKQEGWMAYVRFPSVFWMIPNDITLLALVIIGSTSSILLILNIKPLINSIIVWICFTSLCVIGGDFLVIIIDLFLSEVGFLLILLHLSLRWFNHVPRILYFCFLLLNFRLWFSMGMVKFYFPGSTWTDFTFFENFFPNQPMPTPLAFYFWQTPRWLHILAEFWLFVSQIIIPFFVFGNRKWRLIAFSAIILTSLLIMLSGNYGYFNILSIVLAIVLLHPVNFYEQKVKLVIYDSLLFQNRIIQVTCSVLIFMQFIYCIALIDPKPPCAQNHFNQVFLYKRFQSFPFSLITTPLKPVVYARVCNPYGVFKSIPNFRNELRFSGSYDSINWKPYVFKYVPSGNTNELKWFAPYYPRLDHLLFYETVASGGYNFNLWNPYYSSKNVWTEEIIQKMFDNDKVLSCLLASNPFEYTTPPSLIKCELYSLKFNNPPLGKSTWKEKKLATVFLGDHNQVPKTPLLSQNQINIKSK